MPIEVVIFLAIVLPVAVFFVFGFIRSEKAWRRDMDAEWAKTELPESWLSWSTAAEKYGQGVITDAERDRLQAPYINAERAKHGLPPINVNPNPSPSGPPPKVKTRPDYPVGMNVYKFPPGWAFSHGPGGCYIADKGGTQIVTEDRNIGNLVALCEKVDAEHARCECGKE